MATEIRIDPLTGQRVLIATHRAERPGAGLEVTPAEPIDPADDPFAEGHEDRTPPELFAVRASGGAADGPGWSTRVVPNLYPALSEDPDPAAPGANPDLFWRGEARGAHEVIVNAPEPVSSLAALAPEQVQLALETWRERMRVHAGAACRHLIVNERAGAGASVPHTHAQLYALDFVPAAIARERERFGAYEGRTMGANLLGDLLQQEVRLRERLISVDDEAVLLSPFAAQVPLQMMVVPRTPRARFEDDGPLGAGLLHEALNRLVRLLGAAPPLNLWVRTAPSGASAFCWRIDVLPRLTHLAGLELGAGIGVNTLSPEQAAEELRGA